MGWPGLSPGPSQVYLAEPLRTSNIGNSQWIIIGWEVGWEVGWEGVPWRQCKTLPQGHLQPGTSTVSNSKQIWDTSFLHPVNGFLGRICTSRAYWNAAWKLRDNCWEVTVFVTAGFGVSSSHVFIYIMLYLVSCFWAPQMQGGIKFLKWIRKIRIRMPHPLDCDNLVVLKCPPVDVSVQCLFLNTEKWDLLCGGGKNSPSMSTIAHE